MCGLPLRLLLSLWIDASNDGISLVAIPDGVVVHTEFLGDEMNNSSLLGRQSPRECKLIAHAIILE